MKVTWEVDDGYAGKSRPQVTEIDDEELAEYETEQEKEDFITQCIQDEFEEKITWYEVRRSTN